jgi:hypothetical protein
MIPRTSFHFECELILNRRWTGLTEGGLVRRLWSSLYEGADSNVSHRSIVDRCFHGHLWNWLRDLKAEKDSEGMG